MELLSPLAPPHNQSLNRKASLNPSLSSWAAAMRVMPTRKRRGMWTTQSRGSRTPSIWEGVTTEMNSSANAKTMLCSLGKRIARSYSSRREPSLARVAPTPLPERPIKHRSLHYSLQSQLSNLRLLKISLLKVLHFSSLRSRMRV